MIKSLLERIKNWYEGEYVPYDNDPNSMLILIGGEYKRTRSAKIARAIIEFHAEHWKWAIPVYLTAAGLIVAILKLP